MNRNQGEIEKVQGERAAVAGTPCEEKRRTRDAATALRSVFLGGLYAVFGYLLGACALPFGVYPLGVAWLCASQRRVPYIFVGLCLSAMERERPEIYLVAYVTAMAVRVLVRLFLDKPWTSDGAPSARTVGRFLSALFSEQLGLRMTTAALVAFSIGVFRLFERDFLYYDLYGALLAILVAPVAVLLFDGVNRSRTEGKNTVWTVGVLALSAALVYASRDLRVFYVSVSAFGAMFITLYMTKHEGIVKGVLTGTLCGFAYMPALAPLFAFAALSGGLLMPVSVTLATLGTVAVGSAWALYVRGLAALSGVLPAILSASVLFAVIDRLFLGEKTVEKAAEQTQDVEGAVCCVLPAVEMDGVRLADTAGRVKTVCEGFFGMAEIFESMGRAMQRPCAEELRGICERAFDSSCASCPAKESCWEDGYRENEAEIGRLSSLLHRQGHVTVEGVSEALVARCSRLPDILDEINHNASLHAAHVLQSDKTEIFAADYEAMASILAGTMSAQEDEYRMDTVLSERVASSLQARDLGITGVMVWGVARRYVTVRRREVMTESQREAVVEIIENELGVRVAAVDERRREDGEWETRFGERERFSVGFARRTCRAEGEEAYCGDSVGVFRHGGVQYAFISDGMGSGREAALTSGICSLFLQKMLGAGNRCETVLQMLNGFLRNKGSGSLHECSATVDLMALDLLLGQASFYKCGAAPTYVLRDGSLFKIRSKTLPIGILKKPDQKKTDLALHPSDVIVMVSDGVTQGREECPWLFDLLRQNVERLGIEATADRIVQRAKDEGSTDDLSVLILRVEAI